MKELPEKWCVKVTEENQEILSNWRFTDGKKVPLECYVGMSKYGGPGHTFSKEVVWPNYTEISFEDFETLVLGKPPKPTLKEDYTYLIGILQTINK